MKELSKKQYTYLKLKAIEEIKKINNEILKEFNKNLIENKEIFIDEILKEFNKNLIEFNKNLIENKEIFIDENLKEKEKNVKLLSLEEMSFESDICEINFKRQERINLYNYLFKNNEQKKDEQHKQDKLIINFLKEHKDEFVNILNKNLGFINLLQNNFTDKKLIKNDNVEVFDDFSKKTNNIKLDCHKAKSIEICESDFIEIIKNNNIKETSLIFAIKTIADSVKKDLIDKVIKIKNKNIDFNERYNILNNISEEKTKYALISIRDEDTLENKIINFKKIIENRIYDKFAFLDTFASIASASIYYNDLLINSLIKYNIEKNNKIFTNSELIYFDIYSLKDKMSVSVSVFKNTFNKEHEYYNLENDKNDDFTYEVIFEILFGTEIINKEHVI